MTFVQGFVQMISDSFGFAWDTQSKFWDYADFFPVFLTLVCIVFALRFLIVPFFGGTGSLTMGNATGEPTADDSLNHFMDDGSSYDFDGFFDNTGHAVNPEIQSLLDKYGG